MKKMEDPVKATEVTDDTDRVAQLLRQAPRWCQRHSDNKMPITYEDIAPLMNGGALVRGPFKQFGGQSYLLELHLEGRWFVFASSDPITLPVKIAQC
jgi:hypothetical protein